MPHTYSLTLGLYVCLGHTHTVHSPHVYLGLFCVTLHIGIHAHDTTHTHTHIGRSLPIVCSYGPGTATYSIIHFLRFPLDIVTIILTTPLLPPLTPHCGARVAHTTHAPTTPAHYTHFTTAPHHMPGDSYVVWTRVVVPDVHPPDSMTLRFGSVGGTSVYTYTRTWCPLWINGCYAGTFYAVPVLLLYTLGH